MARLSEQGIRLSSMSPSFLSSNSTSHTWPFSAVAELIDNASDPGVLAKHIWIDVVKEGDDLCLTFTDDGNGMTPNKLHKMLSFGFTDKGSAEASRHAIGVYGNGFKSGSMRLGRDALIFTKNGGCQSVGLLSQTYLENIRAQAVVVPIAPFNQQTKSLIVKEDSEASLAAILQHSIVDSVEKLHQHFDSVPSKKGTKIIIYNLRRAKDGKSEIDFEADESDFRLPEIQTDPPNRRPRNAGPLKAENNIPDIHYSLRAYLSILYLTPRTQVILRGKKVPVKLVSKTLMHVEYDVYRPHFSKDKVKVTFGLNPSKRQHYGIMMYHKNRLIKAFEKVGWQLKASGHRAGTGVIGIIESNFLKPAHNKQDFEYTKEYRLTLGALGQKLNDYWKQITEKRAKERDFLAAELDGTVDGPLWLQCEDCLKWRSVPSGHYQVIPESWNCSQNPNPRYRSCSSPEEAEDGEESLTPSYQKNHKKREKLNNRKRQDMVDMAVCEPRRQSPSEPVRPFRIDLTAERRHPEKTSSADTDRLQEYDSDFDADGQSGDDGQRQQTDIITQAEEEDTKDFSKWPTDIKTNVQSRKDGRRETDVQTTETTEGRLDNLSLTSDSSSQCPMKKRGLLGKRHFDAEYEEENSQMRTETREFTSSDRNTTRASSVRTGSRSPPSTVTSPLCQAERSQVSLEEGDTEAKVQRLHNHLHLDIRRTFQDTKTGTDGSGAAAGWGLVLASAGDRDVGCQTDATQSFHSWTLSSGPTQDGGPPGTKALKRETTDGEECEDSRCAQQELESLRSNVVVLLTALLPQLDLTGISLQTTDVDRVLQQVIEVNSLRL